MLKNKVEKFFKQATANKKRSGVCIVKDALSMVTDKWSLFVMYNLGYYEVLRFSDLKKNIRGISSRMLTVTLKKLESKNIVKRKVHAEVPPRVEYKLTKFGKQLTEKTLDINSWFLDLVLEEKININKQL